MFHGVLMVLRVSVVQFRSDAGVCCFRRCFEGGYVVDLRFMAFSDMLAYA